MKETKELSIRTQFKKDVLVGKSKEFLTEKYGKFLITSAMTRLKKRGYLFKESSGFIKCISEGDNPIRDTYGGATRPKVRKVLTKEQKELKKLPKKDTLGLSEAILPQDTLDTIPESHYSNTESMYRVFQIRTPKEPIGTAYINKNTSEIEISLFQNSHLSEVETDEIKHILPTFDTWQQNRSTVFQNISIILEKSA